MCPSHCLFLHRYSKRNAWKHFSIRIYCNVPSAMYIIELFCFKSKLLWLQSFNVKSKRKLAYGLIWMLLLSSTVSDLKTGSSVLHQYMKRIKGLLFSCSIMKNNRIQKENSKWMYLFIGLFVKKPADNIIRLG